jgi:hypothetical protein
MRGGGRDGDAETTAEDGEGGENGSDTSFHDLLLLQSVEDRDADDQHREQGRDVDGEKNDEADDGQH